MNNSIRQRVYRLEKTLQLEKRVGIIFKEADDWYTTGGTAQEKRLFSNEQAALNYLSNCDVVIYIDV